MNATRRDEFRPFAIDVHPLRLVLELVHASRDDHWELSVIEVPYSVQRVFSLSGVLDALPLGDREAG